MCLQLPPKRVEVSRAVCHRAQDTLDGQPNEAAMPRRVPREFFDLVFIVVVEKGVTDELVQVPLLQLELASGLQLHERLTDEQVGVCTADIAGAVEHRTDDDRRPALQR